MAGLAIAAIIGVFGDGVIGRGRSSSFTGRIVAGFDRVARRAATDRLEFKIHEMKGDSAVELEIPRSFLQYVVVRHINPRPIASHSDMNWVRHVFVRHPTGENAWIGLDLEYVRAGIHRGKFVVDGEECLITQVVLP